METCIDYTGNTAYMSTDERWLINRVYKLAEQNDGSVHIIKEPEENAGTLYCTIPSEWVKISPKKKVELSNERREEIKNRLQNALIIKRTEASVDEY